MISFSAFCDEIMKISALNAATILPGATTAATTAGKNMGIVQHLLPTKGFYGGAKAAIPKMQMSHLPSIPPSAAAREAATVRPGARLVS